LAASSGSQLIFDVEFEFLQPDFFKLFVFRWVGLLDKLFQLLRIATVLQFQLMYFFTIRQAICFQVH